MAHRHYSEPCVASFALHLRCKSMSRRRVVKRLSSHLLQGRRISFAPKGRDLRSKVKSITKWKWSKAETFNTNRSRMTKRK